MLPQVVLVGVDEGGVVEEDGAFFQDLAVPVFAGGGVGAQFQGFEVVVFGVGDDEVFQLHEAVEACGVA